MNEIGRVAREMVGRGDRLRLWIRGVPSCPVEPKLLFDSRTQYLGEVMACKKKCLLYKRLLFASGVDKR